jgi:AcrR family transcriptional regulator
MALDTSLPDEGATRERILSAALSVFAEHGFERATLREITKRAGANIAAVNYHFRSKSDLFKEMVQRFFGPVNDARVAAVDRCIAGLTSGETSLDRVITAMVEPLVALSRDAERGRPLLRIMLQMRGLPRADTMMIMATAFDPVHDRMIEALAVALPHFRREELIWRYDLSRGAILHTLADPTQISRRLPKKTLGELDHADAVGALTISFVRGGFLAGPMLA